jgi:hypothetical protein
MNSYGLARETMERQQPEAFIGALGQWPNGRIPLPAVVIQLPGRHHSRWADALIPIDYAREGKKQFRTHI